MTRRFECSRPATYPPVQLLPRGVCWRCAGVPIPICSVRLIEKGYARQRHPPFARACAHADRLRLASLGAQALSAEDTSVVKQTNRAAHVVVSAVGIAAHSQLLTTIPILT